MTYPCLQLLHVVTDSYRPQKCDMLFFLHLTWQGGETLYKQARGGARWGLVTPVVWFGLVEAHWGSQFKYFTLW